MALIRTGNPRNQDLDRLDIGADHGSPAMVDGGFCLVRTLARRLFWR